MTRVGFTMHVSYLRTQMCPSLKSQWLLGSMTCARLNARFAVSKGLPRKLGGVGVRRPTFAKLVCINDSTRVAGKNQIDAGTLALAFPSLASNDCRYVL
jgi:hypothetical protein